MQQSIERKKRGKDYYTKEEDVQWLGKNQVLVGFKNLVLTLVYYQSILVSLWEQ